MSAAERIHPLGSLKVFIAVDILLDFSTGLVGMFAMSPAPTCGRRRHIGGLVIGGAGTDAVDVAAQAGNSRETHARRGTDEPQTGCDRVIQDGFRRTVGIVEAEKSQAEVHQHVRRKGAVEVEPFVLASHHLRPCRRQGYGQSIRIGNLGVRLFRPVEIRFRVGPKILIDFHAGDLLILKIGNGGSPVVGGLVADVRSVDRHPAGLENEFRRDPRPSEEQVGIGILQAAQRLCRSLLQHRPADG